MLPLHVFVYNVCFQEYLQSQRRSALYCVQCLLNPIQQLRWQDPRNMLSMLKWIDQKKEMQWMELSSGI